MLSADLQFECNCLPVPYHSHTGTFTSGYLFTPSNSHITSRLALGEVPSQPQPPPSRFGIPYARGTASSPAAYSHSLGTCNLGFYSSKMQNFRSLRPVASRLQSSTLPRVSRASFSASTRMSYEHIQVSEPKPGVGQGMDGDALGYHMRARPTIG